MSLKGKNGKLSMIDDARFDSIIDFPVENNIPLMEEYFRLRRMMSKCSERMRNDLSIFTPSLIIVLHSVKDNHIRAQMEK